MNMLHWRQMKDRKQFQAYDYGSISENNKHYGQPYPPVYDPNKISKPMMLFTGTSDLFANL